MNHRMAIRAHGNEVDLGSQMVSFSHQAQRLFVMHMNKTSSEFAINILEIGAAGGAVISMVLEARSTSFSISLVDINDHRANSAVHIRLRRVECFRKNGLGRNRSLPGGFRNFF